MVSDFTLHSVPRGASFTVHKTKCCCAKRQKKLFNLFTPEISSLSVLVELWWDLNHFFRVIHKGRLPRSNQRLCVHACMCTELVGMVTCFVCSQSTTSTTIDRKRGVTTFWLSILWSYQLAIYGLWQESVETEFREMRSLWQLHYPPPLTDWFWCLFQQHLFSLQSARLNQGEREGGKWGE